MMNGMKKLSPSSSSTAALTNYKTEQRTRL